MKPSVVTPCALAAGLLCALILVYPAVRIHPAIRAFKARNHDYLAPVKCGALVRLPPDTSRLPDGSAIYFDNTSGKVVAQCDNPLATHSIDPAKRVICPPKGWTCGP